MLDEEPVPVPELELAPEDGWLELLEDGVELLEELESLGCVLLEPAPAAPPVVPAEPELEGAALDEDDAPPLALSFLLMSIDVDEELEPEGAALGDVVDEELDEGAVLEPAPDGLVVLDELDAPAGLLSARSQPASTAAPNAMETATAKVENFMWPPWLG
ncbi:MAG TPA: hypothetical protein VM183_18805 [Burkholderiales bacterium]|nr:hypothetical protein [Burkholderiales bacterium]